MELVSYRAFYILSLKISSVLKLDRDKRLIDGEQFLTQMIAEYTSCFESSLANGLQDKDKLVEIPEIK